MIIIKSRFDVQNIRITYYIHSNLILFTTYRQSLLYYGSNWIKCMEKCTVWVHFQNQDPWSLPAWCHVHHHAAGHVVPLSSLLHDPQHAEGRGAEKMSRQMRSSTSHQPFCLTAAVMFLVLEKMWKEKGWRLYDCTSFFQVAFAGCQGVGDEAITHWLHPWKISSECHAENMSDLISGVVAFILVQWD